MDSNLKQFIFSTFNSAFDFMRPVLSNYLEFSKSLSKQLMVKDGGNIQYSFDVEIDEIVKKKLVEFQITGSIFSEESGFFNNGDNIYRVVYDPFCNSSLASKTFHEAAMGISIFTYDYKFITSAILDYQTGIVAMVEDNVTNFYQVQSKEKIKFNIVKKSHISEALIVFTLENQEERKSIDKIVDLLKLPNRLIISSGHIYWLKLAMGVVDVYLDPFGGEKLYEMFACSVAQHSGCVVTDIKGKKFDAVENLKLFEKNPEYIYYHVSSRNEHLHSEILTKLFKDL
ncbi:MAG: hypothetical protein O2871_03570 [bacterium]|nr:hypothetical protein [bacterium]